MYSEIELAASAEQSTHEAKTKVDAKDTATSKDRRLLSGGGKEGEPGSTGLVKRPPGRPLPEQQDMFLPCCQICVSFWSLLGSFTASLLACGTLFS